MSMQVCKPATLAALLLLCVLCKAVPSAAAAGTSSQASATMEDSLTPDGLRGRKLLGWKCNARKNMAIFDNNYAYYPTGFIKDSSSARSATACCQMCIRHPKCWKWMWMNDFGYYTCALYDKRPKIRPSSQFITTLGWSEIYAGQIS